MTQPHEWAVVLQQVHDFDDARALYALFLHPDTLCANGLAVDAIVTEAALLSERAFAGFLADHVNRIAGDDWTYTDLYVNGRNATRDEIDRFVERCRAAGVELDHRDIGAPWPLVAEVARSAADRAALAALVARGACANNQPFEVFGDGVELAPGPVTEDEVRDFVARCRQAGVLVG